MPINFSNVHLTIQQFQSVSDGKFNAGEVRLTSETGIEKVNNFVGRPWKNKVSLSHAEVIAIKQAFVKALQQGGVGGEALRRVREQLGLAPDKAVDTKLSERSLKPLSRQQIREILDQNAETINRTVGQGTIRTAVELEARIAPLVRGANDAMAEKLAARFHITAADAKRRFGYAYYLSIRLGEFKIDVQNGRYPGCREPGFSVAAAIDGIIDRFVGQYAEKLAIVDSLKGVSGETRDALKSIIQKQQRPEKPFVDAARAENRGQAGRRGASCGARRAGRHRRIPLQGHRDIRRRTPRRHQGGVPGGGQPRFRRVPARDLPRPGLPRRLRSGARGHARAPLERPLRLPRRPTLPAGGTLRPPPARHRRRHALLARRILAATV